MGNDPVVCVPKSSSMKTRLHDKQSRSTRLLPGSLSSPQGAGLHPRNADLDSSSSPASAAALNSQQQQGGHADWMEGGDAAVVFWWQGKRTAVIRDHNGLLLEQLQPSSCLPWCAGQASATVKYVPYSEILCCRYLPIRRYCRSFSQCQRKQRHYMELQVLERDAAKPWLWSISKLDLAAEQADLIKEWVKHLQQRLRGLSYRPQQLVVFVNPYGGRRQARRTWLKLAEPILTAAGVHCQLVETQYQGHAEEFVRGLSLEQLQQLDGIVAVGGDGLFAELLTAVLQHKQLTAALQLRLGHIPAGSTDAVACTLHGTRDAVTAALHIALGDSTALDVGRMVTLPPAQPQQLAAATGSSIATSTKAGGAQEAAAAAGTTDQSTAHGSGGVVTPSAGVWDAGLSIGSQSELLPGGAEHGMSLAAAGAETRQQPGSTAAPAAADKASRLQRKLLRRRQQEETRKQHQHQQQEAAAVQQHVALHIPQLRHFVCVANYGFLGDVMEMSEKLRFCGPMRYDIAGALRFLMLRQYKATIWYKPAPQHGTASPAAAAASVAAAGAEKQQQQRHAVLSPAAVLPLPHHRAPALHARLPVQGSRPPWSPQHQQQQQQDDHDNGCCHSSHLLSSPCSSSDSSSRRSSIDASGPLVPVSGGGGVIGDAVGAAGPAPAFADAASARADGARTGVVADINATAEVNTQLLAGKQNSKSVSFLPQLAAMVHASAASFSSRGSAATAGSTGGGAAAAAQLASRASSISSQQSNTSRCHSRCSRCSAAALHHSNSRQSFAALAGYAAAAEQAVADGMMSPVGTPPAGSAISPNSTSSSGPALHGAPSFGADGIVQVTPLPSAAAAAAAAATADGGGGCVVAGGGCPPPGPGWVKVEGKFASIMCVVTSCISEKSRQGLMPDAHLADGRLSLVLVEDCSRLQYLRFLMQLASKGIVQGSLPFVKVLQATEVQVEAEGQHSSWNVDGEMLKHRRVSVGIHAGLVDVFARGVELM